jgi:hypothetical protein
MRFRFTPIAASRLDYFIYEEDGDVPCERPSQVPAEAERNGQYHVRESKGIYQDYLCIRGVWYCDGKPRTHQWNIEIWSATAGDPPRCFTQRELDAIKVLQRARLWNRDAHHYRQWQSYLFFVALRDTRRETAGFSRRCLGKRDKHV